RTSSRTMNRRRPSRGTPRRKMPRAEGREKGRSQRRKPESERQEKKPRAPAGREKKLEKEANEGRRARGSGAPPGRGAVVPEGSPRARSSSAGRRRALFPTTGPSRAATRREPEGEAHRHASRLARARRSRHGRGHGPARWRRNGALPRGG